MTYGKVFGVGFHKTGVSSLGRALNELGYRVTGPNFVWKTEFSSDPWGHAMPLIGEFDAFKDNPWPLLFREIDELLPDARFILTVRDPEDWFDSVCRFFGAQVTPMRQWIYGEGSPLGNRSVYLERYESHLAQVTSHFANRPSKLLVFDVFAGDGWSELTDFLGIDEPDLLFPHVCPRIRA